MQTQYDDAKNTFLRLIVFLECEQQLKLFQFTVTDVIFNVFVYEVYKAIINIVCMSFIIMLYNYLLTKAYFHPITRIMLCLGIGTGQTSSLKD